MLCVNGWIVLRRFSFFIRVVKNCIHRKQVIPLPNSSGLGCRILSWITCRIDSGLPCRIQIGLGCRIETDFARDNGHVINKAAYLAIGVRLDGVKDVLGIWIDKEEGAKFWLKVITELRNRGLKDILIACIDGLKGFPEAIESVFPHTQVQLCIVHMVRNSLRFVSYKDRKMVVADLKDIYQALTEEEALSALKTFETKWESRYPMIAKSWYTNWERLNTFFAYPQEIRRIIYTTNAIESMNSTLRKVTKNRGSFPNDDAGIKLLYMAIRNIVKKWTMPLQNWGSAINQMSIIFKGRIPQ